MTSNIPTAFRLNHLDIPSIHKFGIGFDSIFEDIHRLATVAGKDNYPPYNVIQIDEDHYSIELALAGIDKDALDIELPAELFGDLHAAVGSERGARD